MRVIDKEQLKPCLALGFDLIPIRKWDALNKQKRAAGKIPRDNEWVIAPYSRKAILDWIKKGGNLGVRLPAEHVVIDIDPKHDDAKGRSAVELLEELEIELGVDLGDAPTVETGSGGWHVYLTKPPDQRVRNTIDLFGGAIEFKSYGRQVLAPGSKHPNGATYRWVRNQTGPLPVCPAELWELIAKPKPEDRKRGEGDTLTISQIKGCLEQLDPTEFREYDSWRNLLFSIHYAAGGDLDARDLFVRWSTSDPEYRDAKEMIEQFWEHSDEQRGDARTEKTLFYHVLQAGGTIPLNLDALDEIEQPEDSTDEEERPLPMFERNQHGRIKHTIAENVISACGYLGIGIREDVFSGKRYMVDSRSALQNQFGKLHEDDLTDHIIELIALTITRELPYWTGDPSKGTMKRAKEAIVVEYHPLQQWLESLVWDGTPRLDTWLIDTSDLPDTSYNRAVSRLCLYAAVGRAMHPGIKFDTMIILEGPQGGYKSTLIRWLAGQWTAEGLPPISGHNYKDVVSAMRGRWLIEIEELASMKKSDVDVLKAFLSKTEDRARLPYEEETRTFKRQCIFIGTTNDREYLRDITGNRRFLPLEVGMIHDVTDVPREQLWAEALVEWRRNRDSKEITLPSTLWLEASDVQESRRVRDPWEDRLEEFLFNKWVDETELSTETIFFDCLQMNLQRAHTSEARRLAQIMQRLGWERCKFNQGDRRVRGYRKKESRR